MPYYIYNREEKDNKILLSCEDEISLAGCNNGIIVKELKKILKPEHNPNLGWSINIAKQYNINKSALVIDLNPKGTESSLAEIDTVFGFTYKDWSPIMFRLRLLTYWEDKNDIDENNIITYPIEEQDVIYTVSYLKGSFENGELNGKWIFPGPSSTNALLWFPEASSFFYSMMQKFDPDSLAHEFRVING